jgi:hypothetical protein
LQQSDPSEPFFASVRARPQCSAPGSASETGASISRASSYAMLDNTKAAAVERILISFSLLLFFHFYYLFYLIFFGSFFPTITF